MQERAFSQEEFQYQGLGSRSELGLFKNPKKGALTLTRGKENVVGDEVREGRIVQDFIFKECLHEKGTRSNLLDGIDGLVN